MQGLCFREKPKVLTGGNLVVPPRFPSGIRAVGLDCDGTLTNSVREGVHFRRFFKEGLRARLGYPMDFDSKWDKFQKVVDADLASHGWILGGKMIAPAHTDALIFCQAVTKYFLAEAGITSDSVVGTEVYELLKPAYRYTIPYTYFKPGLSAFLYGLRANMERVFILTNSRTDDVAEKLLVLDGQNGSDHSKRVPVEGDARKFVLEPGSRYFELQTTRNKVYYDRPVYQQRLADLTAGIPRDKVAFFGDSLHLDGAGALAMGICFVFMPNPRTPKEEIDYVLSHPRGYVLDSFERRT